MVEAGQAIKQKNKWKDGERGRRVPKRLGAQCMKYDAGRHPMMSAAGMLKPLALPGVLFWAFCI